MNWIKTYIQALRTAGQSYTSQDLQWLLVTQRSTKAVEYKVETDSNIKSHAKYTNELFHLILPNIINEVLLGGSDVFSSIVSDASCIKQQKFQDYST